MLDLTGGDAAALAEIRTALELIAAQDDPDLVAALRLARHRDDLTDRNTNIPPFLPAVWATLGHPTRAEALARSITDPDRQARALAAVAGRWPRPGSTSRPRGAAQAETVARSITDPDRQAAGPGAWRGAGPGRLARRPASTQPRPRAWPAPSPTRTGRRQPWPRWRGRWPRPASTSRPRAWPARSPTRTGRRQP